jgi:hypothetical protein
MKKIIFLNFFFLSIFLFLGVSFSSAYFAKFLIGPESINVSVSSLETSSQNITVSIDPLYDYGDEEAQYEIERFAPTDGSPDLCPYLSMSANEGETTENGFPLNASYPFWTASGQLYVSGDETDIWTISITSPCFEGECPAGYNSSTEGNPLLPVLKGVTFKCNLSVKSSFISQVRGIGIRTAYAATTNTMAVSAIFTGLAEQKIDPVIIIPGIMGSAKKNDELVIDPILHTYDDLIATLKANGYVEGKDLFTFPYEWRDSNVLTASLLKDKINEVKSICGCSKVDIVAHSMGGLVARQYIEYGGYQNDIDQLIFLGTPHKGSPKAYLQWEAGEFPPTFFDLLTKKFFEIEALENGYLSLFSYIQNRPISSVQNLLPVFDYLKDKDMGILRTYPTNYPKNTFLEALNTNTGTQKLLNSGVKITNIVGDAGATSTINNIRVVAGSNPIWIDGKPDGFDGQTIDRGLEMGTGDGTVTATGSILNNSITNQQVSGVHQRIPTLAEAKVFNILTGKTAETTFDNDYGVDIKILLLQLLSPVDFVVTAPDGKKIGKNFVTGEEYNEIADAFYSGYQNEEEYITILNPLDGNYKIQMQGTGSGKYTVASSYINNATSTTAQFTGTTTVNQLNNLNLNLNNTHPEAISTDPDVVADINMAYNLGWIKDVKTRDTLLASAKLLVNFKIQTSVVKNRKQEIVVKTVNKILAKTMSAGLSLLLKNRNINQQAYDLLKSDLNWLINH